MLEGIIWFLNNLVIEIESPSSLRLYQYSISSQSLLPVSKLIKTNLAIEISRFVSAV